MLRTHENWLRRSLYAPKLAWKKGETDAFRSVSAAISDITTPIFLMPPAGAFDHDEQKILSPSDHIKAFGPKLREARRDRPVFVDGLFLDDARHRAAFTEHPLTALLERARLANAQAWPVTSYGRSDEYQQAVAKAHLLHDWPVGIQIKLSDLGSASLNQRLRNLLNQISCDAKDCVLFVDCGPLHFSNQSEEVDFADGFIHAINLLPFIYEWCQIVFVATSLGATQKIKKNEQKLIRRSEWHIYTLLLARKSELFRVPVFGDYGTEYRESLAPIKARPSAKLPYTTDTSLYFVKGENVSTGGYAAIFPVADHLVKSMHFYGANFSLGDARLWLMSLRQAGTGNAPTWRWICADHHLTVTAKLLSEVHGVPNPPAPNLAATQQELFSVIPAK